MTKKFLVFGFLLCVSAATSFAQSKNASKPASETKQIPVSYGIVVDNSGSYRMLLAQVAEAAKDIVEENKPDDETFLVRFVDSSKISLVQDFTDSKSDIQDAADQMYIEGGLTAILDAVDFSARHLSEKAMSESNRRRVLVLITDGDDRKSKAKLEEVLKFLKDEKIQVYVIGLSDEKVSTKLLDKLTKETGGKIYTPKNRAEITTVIKELAAAIRVE